MKSLIAALLVMAGAAHAQVVTPLQSPPRASVSAPSFSCSPSAFDAFDAFDNVHGYCQTYTARSTGGRGANIVYSYTVYATAWNADGTVANNTLCGTVQLIGPHLQSWVYVLGYGPANCQQPTGNTGPFALIDGHWYTVKAYSTDGAYEAASGNSGPVVVDLTGLGPDYGKFE